MLGTIVNTATILIGGVLGSFLGTGIKEKYKKALFDALGLCCIVLGINASLPNMTKTSILSCLLLPWLSVASLAHDLICKDVLTVPMHVLMKETAMRIMVCRD